MGFIARHAITGALLATLCAFGAGPAAASHYTGSCSTELNAVETAIDDAVFLGKKAGTDESNLDAKLDAAAAKIALQKYSDAIDKLENISDTATALAGAPKPKLDDATGINSAVSAAITCVGGL